MSDKLKTVVKRSEWCRGERNSSLLRTDGKKCCLGFRALALGQTPDEIRPMMYPRDGWEGAKKYQDWMDAALGANDSLRMSEKAREKELKRIFREAGERIEFMD